MDTIPDDAARFARFVCARTEVPEYPIQHIGSGFTFLIDQTVCLITARHVVVNNNANPMAVILPPIDGSRRWWSSDACVHLDATEPYADDPTYADLGLYSMHTPPSLRRYLSRPDFLTIPNDLRLAENVPLVAFGYPHQNTEIDIEQGTFTGERFEIEGSYGGSTRFRGLHVFASPELERINPSGMSGGPIAVRLQDGKYVLAGIIVQGSRESQRLHFVSSEWVIGALEYGLPGLFKTRAEFHGDQIDVEQP